MNTFGEISIVVVLLSLLLKLLFVDDDEDILPRYEKESELFVTNSLFTTVSFTRRISDTKTSSHPFLFFRQRRRRRMGNQISTNAPRVQVSNNNAHFFYSLSFSLLLLLLRRRRRRRIYN
jgi:hypothetical protein